MNLARFGMDTVTLTGSLEAKLHAMRDAGFAQVMLWASDLAGHPAGVAEAVRMVQASGLRVTGLQVLRDFEGLDGAAHACKMGVARELLQMCRMVAAPLLLVCSSTSTHASGAFDALARDLASLAALAAPLGVRVAYEGLSWGRHVYDLEQAWDVVDLANHPNLGLVIDAFHLLARETRLDCLAFIPSDRIFLVQLSDFLWPALAGDKERMDTARHARVFPGQGVHDGAVAGLVQRLERSGYRGDFSFEVCHDDYLQLTPAFVAQLAHRAAHWVAGQALARRQPGAPLVP